MLSLTECVGGIPKITHCGILIDMPSKRVELNVCSTSVQCCFGLELCIQLTNTEFAQIYSMPMCAKTQVIILFGSKIRLLPDLCPTYDDHYHLRTESLPFPRSTNGNKKSC